MNSEETLPYPCMWDPSKICNCRWELLNREDLPFFLKNRLLVYVLQKYAGIDQPGVRDLADILSGIGKRFSFHKSTAVDEWMITPPEVKNFVWRNVGIPRRMFLKKYDPKFNACPYRYRELNTGRK